MTLMDKLFDLNKKLYSAHTGVGFGVIASSKQTVVLPVGGWVELARTTLGSNSSTIDVTGLPDKRYYMIVSDFEVTTTANNEILRLNADGANNYAMRHNADGTSEQSFINQPGMRNQANTNPVGGQPVFWMGYIANLSAKEKLFQAWAIKQGAVGAGNTTPRAESIGKWANTVDAVDQMTLLGESTGNTHITGSEMVVLGWDPADVHTNNFWEELDTATGASIDLSFTGKKYLWLQFFLKATGGTLNPRMRIGNTTVDSGTNYANRGSSNGEADATSINQAFFDILGITLQTGESMFGNCFIINNASNEKLVILHSVSNNGSGAGNPPDRFEYVGKLADTTNLMDVLQITKNSGTGTQDTSSFAKIWGSD